MSLKTRESHQKLMTFLVTLCENLLEQNPFSEVVKSPKTKGNTLDEFTEIVLTFESVVGIGRNKTS